MPLCLRRRRPVLARLGLGVAAGLLIALSVPPYGWWPLAVVGYGVIALGLGRATGRQRLALGAAAGIAQYSVGIWWVNEFSLPGCIVLIAVSALWVTAALWLVASRHRLGVMLGLPAVMVLSDWGRARYPLGGFPLGGTSLGQAGAPWASVLRVGGSLGLTAATVFAGVALAAVIEAIRGRDGRRASVGAAFALVAGLVAVVALSNAAPDGSGAPRSGANHIRVALVQGGGPRGTRAVNTDPELIFQRQTAASGGLASPLDLVVWPEATLQVYQHPVASTSDGASVASLAESLPATVVVGVEQNVGPQHYLNAAYAWAPDGQIVGNYVKNHRVPFGEYIPARSLLNRFFNLTDVPLDAVAGHGPGILHTPAGPLGVMISYEVFYDGRARGAVNAGGQVLVVPTNTASYRSDQVPAQELAAARLRSIETGRALLQVTPTGYTAIVSPGGHVQEKTVLGARQVLTDTVPLRTGRTWYVRIGDAPVAWLALAMLAAAQLAAHRRVATGPVHRLGESAD